MTAERSIQFYPEHTFSIEGNCKPVGKLTWLSLYRVLRNEPFGDVVHLFCRAHEVSEREDHVTGGLGVLYLEADEGGAFVVCVGPKFDVAIGRYLDLAHGQSLAWFSSPWSPPQRATIITQEAQDRAA